MTDPFDRIDDEQKRREDGTRPDEKITDRIAAPGSGMFTTPAPRREYLVEQDIRFTDENGDTTRTETRGVIGRGQLHILGGEGGAGKGRWLLAVVAAMGSTPRENVFGGRHDVCGLRVNPIRNGEKVLLLLGEDDAIDFHQRCEGVAEALRLNKEDEDRFRETVRWGSAHGLAFSIVDASTSKDVKAAAASGDFTALVAWLKENGPWAFIGLDPFARFSGVDENDNALQTKVLGYVESLTTVNGNDEKGNPRPRPAVLVVDHTSKPAKGETGPPSQHMLRGASAKVNSARVVMMMNPGGGDEARVDYEGRSVVEVGFDDSRGVATAFAGDVGWYVVKNNGQQKANCVSLAFTKHGGLLVETPEQTQARRKRQWHAADAKGQIKDGKKNKGKARAPTTKEETDYLDDVSAGSDA